MCLIIAFIAIVYAFSAFNSGDTALGISALVIAVFFTGLLIKNILDVKKMRSNSQHEQKKEEN